MWEYNSTEELYHYGVLGMKWGVRRAARKATKDLRRAKNKSTAANKAYKDAYKKAKSDAVDKLYSKQDKRANARVNNMSTGKAVVQSMLMGSYGALKYNEARARGESRGKAAVEGILYSAANNSLGGLLSAGKYIENRRARKKS